MVLRRRFAAIHATAMANNASVLGWSTVAALVARSNAAEVPRPAGAVVTRPAAPAPTFVAARVVLPMDFSTLRASSTAFSMPAEALPAANVKNNAAASLFEFFNAIPPTTLRLTAEHQDQ